MSTANRKEAPVKPSVGRIVHYVSHGTPLRPDGSQAYDSQCRAAVITEVPADDDYATVGLCVLNPTGQFFNQDIPYHDGSGTAGDPDCPNAPHEAGPHRYCGCGWSEPTLRGGTWHWPERV